MILICATTIVIGPVKTKLLTTKITHNYLEVSTFLGHCLLKSILYTF